MVRLWMNDTEEATSPKRPEGIGRAWALSECEADEIAKAIGEAVGG